MTELDRTKMPPPRVLGQISIEMFAGPKPAVMTPQAEQAAPEELTGQTPQEPLGNPSRADPEDIEANRIAGELRKLTDAGAIKVKAKDDPEAIFCAGFIKLFGATYRPSPLKYGSSPDGNPPPGVFVPGKPYIPTKEQRVRIPYGLTKKEQEKFLQDDLDSLND